MILLVLGIFINLFVTVFSAILLLRIILSYILKPYNRFMGIVVNITEPLLASVRRILPPSGGLDLAPLVVLLLLNVVQTLAAGVFERFM